MEHTRKKRRLASKALLAYEKENNLKAKCKIVDHILSVQDCHSNTACNTDSIEKSLNLERQSQNTIFNSSLGFNSEVFDQAEVEFIPLTDNYCHWSHISDNDSSNDFDDDLGSPSDEGDIETFLRKWVHDCKSIPQAHVSKLLTGLKVWFPDLPKDARTLMKTPKSVDLEKMGDGHYFNFGLRSALLSKLDDLDLKETLIHLNFNIDGMSVSKSSKMQFWPILCSVEEDSEKTPFIISLYSGAAKPPLQQFLSNFVTELKDLLENGIIHNAIVLKIAVRAFICDAPARAFIKGIKHHNGYHGCDRCVQRGVYVSCMTFPELNSLLRTDESFRRKSDKSHHREDSPLLLLPEVHMVNCFPQDYMHLVCLGVTRRLLMTWTGKYGKRNGCLSSQQIHQLNSYMCSLQSVWPSEFSRKPRTVQELDYWKATEFRQFLLYIGPVVLKNLLSKEHYEHFMLFSIAISILCIKGLHISLNDMSTDFLLKFVEGVVQLYEHNSQVYNVHSLIHLSSDALRLGVLDEFSTFPFENFLYQLKRLLHKGNQPLQQIVKRLAERKSAPGKVSVKFGSRFIPVSSSRNESNLQCGLSGISYSRVKNDDCVLSVKEKDSCVSVKAGYIVKILNFVCTPEGTLFLIGRKYRKKRDFFSKPCPSSVIGTFRVSGLRKSFHIAPVSDIVSKNILLPYKDGFVSAVLHHFEPDRP